MENGGQQTPQGLPVGRRKGRKKIIVVLSRRGDELLRQSTATTGEGKDPPAAVRRVDGAADEPGLDQRLDHRHGVPRVDTDHLSEPRRSSSEPEPKTVTVSVPAEAAFRAYVERPMEWVPPTHRMTMDTASMTIEPRVGGHFYETAADGTEATRGMVVEWAPPSHLAMTWRVGTGWQPLADDEHAPHVEVDFKRAGPTTTEVTVAYTHLERCDPAFADQLFAVLSAPGAGETLERYARVAEQPPPEETEDDA